MTGAPCFKCSKRVRIAGHVVCVKCHDPSRCDKCAKSDELATRMRKRRATIEAKRGGKI